MPAPRIVYLATADARGHLMRAQLLTHALRARGAQVDVLTTSDAGAAFLAGFGIDAPVLSRLYAVQFDRHQNMQRGRTDRTIAAYTLLPQHMGRDLWRLHRLSRGADLLVNDSFHPALLSLGALGLGRRVVHVYGGSLRRALQDNFAGRWPAPLACGFSGVVGALIDRAHGRIEHDFAHATAQLRGPRTHVLPTPVAPAPATPPEGALPEGAAVYLNPHFTDPAFAASIEQGLQRAGLRWHGVAEGLPGRPGWHAFDAHWVAKAAHARVIVSAPGMAALSAAQVYRRPIVLLVTDQPEQQTNAARAQALGVRHRVVRCAAGGDVAAPLAQALGELLSQQPDTAPDTGNDAHARLRLWADTLWTLAAQP